MKHHAGLRRAYHWAILILVVFLSQCANPVAPTGGPKDSTPPKLDVDESTANEQTLFRPEKIRLVFDEYITVQNPNQNVIISPPLDPKPSFQVGSDYLEIDFSAADSLLDETTYSFNLDNAISDFNEGNPVENLVFVFSTGPYLDSLSLRVTVVDKDKKPAEGITVMLYSGTPSDSVVVKSLPTYFSKSNAEGVAHLQYLQAGTYKVFALKDDNLTLKYDIPGAPIAFRKDPITLTEDTLDSLTLSLFVPSPVPKITRKPFLKNNAYVGVFNPMDTSIRCQIEPGNREVSRQWVQDSLYIWTQVSDPSDSIVWITDNEESIRKDTLAPLVDVDTVSIQSRSKSLRFFNKSTTVIWNQPIEDVSDSTFFAADSLGTRYYFSVADHNPLKTRIQFEDDSIPTTSRDLLVLPGSIQSTYGYTLTDTLKWSFSVKQPEELSELILNLNFPDSTAQYVGQLIKNNAVVKERSFDGQNKYLWEIPFLEPGSYGLKIYWDQNRNGRQDGGDYWKSRQAEPAKTFSLEPLRENWTIEEEIDWEYEAGSKELN